MLVLVRDVDCGAHQSVERLIREIHVLCAVDPLRRNGTEKVDVRRVLAQVKVAVQHFHVICANSHVDVATADHGGQIGHPGHFDVLFRRDVVWRPSVTCKKIANKIKKMQNTQNRKMQNGKWNKIGNL